MRIRGAAGYRHAAERQPGQYHWAGRALAYFNHAQPPGSAGALRHGHRLCRARSSWIDALADRSTPSDRRRVAQHLAELRQVNGLDVTTLAARANLDPEVVAEIEAGTRTWTLDELSALAFGLGVTMTAICRRWDPPAAIGQWR
jgi:hypothetical protein